MPPLSKKILLTVTVFFASITVHISVNAIPIWTDEKSAYFTLHFESNYRSIERKSLSLCRRPHLAIDPFLMRLQV
jgi:hypothetical protein